MVGGRKRGRKRCRRVGRKVIGKGLCMVKAGEVSGWFWMLLGVFYVWREVVERQVREYII